VQRQKKKPCRKKRSLIIAKAETILTKEDVGYMGGGREKREMVRIKTVLGRRR